MRKVTAFTLSAACIVGLSVTAGSTAPPQTAESSMEPPMPFEDVGACPFEGCVYREWVANAEVDVKSGRGPGDPVAFRLKPGDRVQAITGIVITTKPGRVTFRAPIDLPSVAGPVHIEPGETLYLLTYHGEGSTTAWFKGRLYDWLDGSEFFNGLCELRPGSCNGSIAERPQRMWWVRLHNLRGVAGWSHETSKFDNKDRFR